jgi:hypothetical protein
LAEPGLGHCDHVDGVAGGGSFNCHSQVGPLDFGHAIWDLDHGFTNLSCTQQNLISR